MAICLLGWSGCSPLSGAPNGCIDYGPHFKGADEKREEVKQKSPFSAKMTGDGFLFSERRKREMKKALLIENRKDSIVSVLECSGHYFIDKRILFRRIATIILILNFMCFSFTSLLRAKEAEVKKEGQVQKDEMKQAQGANPNESKQGVKEGPSKEPSSLTEEEQREFEKSAGPGWQGPGVFKTKEEAIKYLKILVKGDEKTIRYFQQAEKGYRKYAYDSHLAIALSAIHTETNKEGFNLAVEVLKTKRDYPEALAEAAKKLRFANDPSIIPILREVVKSPNPSVKLQAAGS